MFGKIVIVNNEIDENKGTPKHLKKKEPSHRSSKAIHQF